MKNNQKYMDALFHTMSFIAHFKRTSLWLWQFHESNMQKFNILLIDKPIHGNQISLLKWTSKETQVSEIITQISKIGG